MALGSRARAYLRGPEIGPRPAAPALTGAARLDRRTKDLVKRLRPNEIAVIDHAGLDRIAAEDLVACGALAVINVADSCSGTYPNSGPLVLANAGVRLIDVPGAPLFDELDDGEQISVIGAEVRCNGTVLATGELIDLATASEKLERQRELIDDALVAFAENTMEHARGEVELLSGKIDLPAVRTQFRARHALIVVRGTTYKRDLRALRAYIEDTKPVLVGVDGGADAILEEGFVPDVVLGDMDSASDAVLGCGAELLVHAYANGEAPGIGRLERLGLEFVIVPAAGTSQDVAMLLAFEKGAELIVSVGAHFNLTEFLDKNRSGMSSTFLTRLRIGEILVDAKGVSRLYNPGVRGWQMWAFLAVALVLIVVVVLSSPALAEFFDLVWLKIKIALDLSVV
jgi:uncharacterized membrane-anchored protein